MRVGNVSGYFNPIHYGHIEYIQGAKARCDHLVVIVNSDLQVNLKGSKPFMDEHHRMKILNSIKGVDTVILASDTDKTVCMSLIKIRRLYPKNRMLFFNSGDRKAGNLNSAEVELCKEIDIEYVVLDLPKLYSSSELLKKL
jgi:cytidyltransferase-like protein